MLELERERVLSQISSQTRKTSALSGTHHSLRKPGRARGSARVAEVGMGSGRDRDLQRE